VYREADQIELEDHRDLRLARKAPRRRRLSIAVFVQRAWGVVAHGVSAPQRERPLY